MAGLRCKSPAGVKSDELDAWCFADALPSDGHGWRELKPLDPLTNELRLHEYYPAALAAFDDWTSTGAWDFVLAFPTPQVLVKRGKCKWENFLHAHKLYRPD